MIHRPAISTVAACNNAKCINCRSLAGWRALVVQTPGLVSPTGKQKAPGYGNLVDFLLIDFMASPIGESGGVEAQTVSMSIWKTGYNGILE